MNENISGVKWSNVATKSTQKTKMKEAGGRAFKWRRQSLE